MITYHKNNISHILQNQFWIEAAFWTCVLFIWYWEQTWGTWLWMGLGWMYSILPFFKGFANIDCLNIHKNKILPSRKSTLLLIILLEVDLLCTKFHKFKDLFPWLRNFINTNVTAYWIIYSVSLRPRNWIYSIKMSLITLKEGISETFFVVEATVKFPLEVFLGIY